MHLFILIIGLVLFPQAYTLKCFTCVGDSACPQMQCPAEKNQCAAIRALTYHGNSQIIDITSKSCLATQQCFQGSINFGVARTVVTGYCCNSDSCNDKSIPDPPKPKPNGKKCYRCDGNANCTGTLNCDGDEDRCLKASVTVGGETKTMKGCATKSVCVSSNMDIPGFSGTISCCEGDYCNSAKGVSASLLVLATMLMSIYFLSS